MLKIVADQLIQEQDVIIYPGIMADQMVQEHTLYTSYMQDAAHSDTAYKLIQECNMLYITDHDKRIKTWCQNILQDVTQLQDIIPCKRLKYIKK